MKYRLAFLLVAAGALTGCQAEQPPELVNVTASADPADVPPPEAASEFPQLERGEAFDGVIVTYDFQILPVKYERIGDYAVIGGDMIIGEHEEMQRRWAVYTGLATGNLDIVPAPERRAIVMLADQTGRGNSPLVTGPFADQGDGAGTVFTGPMAQQLVRVLGWVTLDPLWPSRVIAYDVAPPIRSRPGDPRNANIQKAVDLWNALKVVQLRPAANASPAERQRGVLLFVDHMADDDAARWRSAGSALAAGRNCTTLRAFPQISTAFWMLAFWASTGSAARHGRRGSVTKPRTRTSCGAIGRAPRGDTGTSSLAWADSTSASYSAVGGRGRLRDQRLDPAQNVGLVVTEVVEVGMERRMQQPQLLVGQLERVREASRVELIWQSTVRGAVRPRCRCSSRSRKRVAAPRLLEHVVSRGRRGGSLNTGRPRRSP